MKGKPTSTPCRSGNAKADRPWSLPPAPKPTTSRKFVDENDQTVPADEVRQFVTDRYQGGRRRSEEPHGRRSPEDQGPDRPAGEPGFPHRRQPGSGRCRRSRPPRTTSRTSRRKRRATWNAGPPRACRRPRPPGRPTLKVGCRPTAGSSWAATNERRCNSATAHKDDGPTSNWGKVAAGRDKGEPVVLTINGVTSVDKTKQGSRRC